MTREKKAAVSLQDIACATKKEVVAEHVGRLFLHLYLSPLATALRNVPVDRLKSAKGSLSYARIEEHLVAYLTRELYKSQEQEWSMTSLYDRTSEVEEALRTLTRESPRVTGSLEEMIYDISKHYVFDPAVASWENATICHIGEQIFTSLSSPYTEPLHAFHAMLNTFSSR